MTRATIKTNENKIYSLKTCRTILHYQKHKQGYNWFSLTSNYIPASVLIYYSALLISFTISLALAMIDAA